MYKVLECNSQWDSFTGSRGSMSASGVTNSPEAESIVPGRCMKDVSNDLT